MVLQMLLDSHKTWQYPGESDFDEQGSAALIRCLRLTNEDSWANGRIGQWTMLM